MARQKPGGRGLRLTDLSPLFCCVQKFIQQSDQNQSGDVNLAEFINYVREHEKKLRLVFANIDSDRDGRIKVNEIIGAFKELGITIQRQEAVNLLKRWYRAGGAVGS